MDIEELQAEIVRLRVENEMLWRRFSHIQKEPVNKNVLKINDLCDVTGLSRSYIYKLIAEGKFPAPNKLGNRIASWDRKIVDKWITANLLGS